VNPPAAPPADVTTDPHGSDPLKVPISARLASVSTGVPFCTFAGVAQSAFAPSMSPARSAAVHARMTLVRRGSAARAARSGTLAGSSRGSRGSSGVDCGVSAAVRARG